MTPEELQNQIEALTQRINVLTEKTTSGELAPPIFEGLNYHVDRLRKGTFMRKSITADYTAQPTDVIIAITSISALLTVTLPSAVAAGAGKILIVKDEAGAATTYNIDVTRTGSETIDGSTAKSITTNYSLLRLYSNGANWFTF